MAERIVLPKLFFLIGKASCFLKEICKDAKMNLIFFFTSLLIHTVYCVWIYYFWALFKYVWPYCAQFILVWVVLALFLSALLTSNPTSQRLGYPPSPRCPLPSIFPLLLHRRTVSLVFLFMIIFIARVRCVSASLVHNNISFKEIKRPPWAGVSPHDEWLCLADGLCERCECKVRLWTRLLPLNGRHRPS